MTTSVAHDHHHHAESKAVFGLWIYILSDVILFAALFASYVVLKNNTFGGVGIKQIASLPYVYVETLFLLVSSFTYGMCFLSVRRQSKEQVMLWLTITFILGLGFVAMEYHEFANLIHTGNSWQRSAFLSAFFTLVGIHGLHVVAGLIWMIVLMFQFMKLDFSPRMRTRFVCLGLFWHFLDLVWVFIFTIVYLMGAI